ncbi:MAG: M14 family zinc carboxypeptidase [Clostridiaceae bacterium]|nr:M14 family zinc carboxypeptidase [Clostridiaceae bacterium]
MNSQVFEELISNIPDYKEFLTVEELDEHSRKLAKENPDVVSLFEIGSTKDGYPLLCLKIGNGSQNALMFGCPHPNEPIGTMMLEYFSESLAKNKALREELDYTWYIVKAWDADGLRLNKNWLKGPYTIYNYSRNFFRPAGHMQVDWTFPVDYKELHFHDSIPETKAMMSLIDKIKPSFIYSLHNAGFGGVYWYISGPLPKLYPQMYEAADRMHVPLNLGEPEAPYCIPFAPAIYQSLGIEQEYDYLEKYLPEGSDIVSRFRVGNCSESYARTLYGSFTLLTELPYFFDKRIMDKAEGTMLRKDAILQHLEENAKSNKYLLETLELTKQYMNPMNPFKLALEAFTVAQGDDATRSMVSKDPDFARKATVAEEFDNLLVTRFYKSLSYGMLIRANEYELEAMERLNEKNPQKTAALEKARDIAIFHHKELTDLLEKEINYEVVPIRKLVSIQLECGLLVSKYLHEHNVEVH